MVNLISGIRMHILESRGIRQLGARFQLRGSIRMGAFLLMRLAMIGIRDLPTTLLSILIKLCFIPLRRKSVRHGIIRQLLAEDDD